MGWWVGRPWLDQDESVLWTAGANRQQTLNRSVGGRLFLTEERLIFHPNRVDVLLSGEPWFALLSEIREIDMSPRRATVPFLGQTAANRNRLKVVQVSGDVDLFVVNHLASVIERLTSALIP
jgi:hypothetical protein